MITHLSSCRSGFPLVAIALFMSGCSLIFPPPDTPDPVFIPQLPPSPVLLPSIEEVIVEPAPLPVIIEPEPAAPEPIVLKVAVVLSSRAPSYENVALELAKLLEDYEIYDLSDKSLTQKDAFDAIGTSGARAVVAVGLRAASFARTITDIPVVFSQVFNFNEIGLNGENLRVVAAMPPLDMQLKAWRQLNPGLKSIGAILGEGHDDLIEEAMRATETVDISFRHLVASSDRETLYHFMRLAQEIDGFWLFPDNRILSSSILRQMLDYAAAHGVQIAVFNDALLSLGAVISTTSVNADIAQTIVSVINHALSEGLESVPVTTPLSEISVRTNSVAEPKVAMDAESPLQDSQ